MKNDLQNKSGLSPDKLDQALATAEDLLTRAQVPFLVLGDTLKGVLKEELYGEGIELGVRERYLTKGTLGMLKLVNPDLEFRSNSIYFEYEGVPVEIQIIKRNYKCLENPDTVFYKITEYKIPNPLDRYFQAMYLIK
ncbi:MAG: hypothetical protein PHV11_05545 [Candidatus Bipolaricaulis sp.]|nr:hypothetical protein [Candidatus Bipolaricaulis sp.]